MNEFEPPEALNSPEYKQMLQQCIHCGLCLQACPTYTVFGTESDAPRGRIALMRAVSDGRIAMEGPFEAHIDLCLGCRACETACPSGVQYGSLVEAARISLESTRRHGLLERVIRWLALRQMLPHLNRLKWIARFGRLYQMSGLQRLVRSLNILPERLKLMEGMLPVLPARYPDYRRPAPAIGVKHGAVAFFHGCVQEAFLARVNAATVRVLQRNGFDVHVPRSQTCCGAAQLHLGELEQARQLARRNIDAFEEMEKHAGRLDAIINNAGGCGATLKEYAHLLRGDPDYTEKARQFVDRIKDISEFLAGHLNAIPSGEVHARVTYADSCHLRHAQKVVRQPRDLLKAIPGLDLVELKRADHCCGSAGVYNLLQVESANAVLDRKMADIAATGAEFIVASNTGCYFQYLYGTQRAHSKARVVHLVELLDQSYRDA